MKIKIIEKPLEEVLKIPLKKRIPPKKPSLFWNSLIRLLSSFEINKSNSNLSKVGMEKLGKNEPCLILQNHTSFFDLKIAKIMTYPRPLNIVTTADAFIGLDWLLREIGCFPTRKFVREVQTIKDIQYCLNTLKTSVLLFPEAGYTFDGTATTLPENLGRLVKILGVPLVTLISSGVDLAQPLFNNLLKRKVKFEAQLKYQLSSEQIKEMSAEEITKVIEEAFSFDSYKWQQNNGVIINEPERALGLERILYKCPNCGAEEKTVGKGATLTCTACGKAWELTEKGFIKAVEGETEFNHIPDWYKWERKCAREQLEQGDYESKTDVDIYVQIDTKGLYHTGSGTLTQNKQGLFIHDDKGNLIHHQTPLFSHSLNSDFYWYQIGDYVGLGTDKIYYGCVGKNNRNFACKARLIAEELYKMEKEK